MTSDYVPTDRLSAALSELSACLDEVDGSEVAGFAAFDISRGGVVSFDSALGGWTRPKPIVDAFAESGKKAE